MNPVQFGEATAAQIPSSELSSSPIPPSNPPPQPPKHFNWPWHKWVLLVIAAVIFSLAIAYLANRPQLLNIKNVEGKFCGGIAANLPENQCPTGYTCKLDSNYPDASGKCIKQ